MEVTKWLKPSISVSRIGDSASVQAATRVNVEQASKRKMCRPTRLPYRGRLKRLVELSESTASCYTGVDKESVRNTGSPKARSAMTSRTPARDRLGISTVRDRICMTAAMLVLEPIFEADLPPEQYAYRPGRNAQQAVVKVDGLLFRGHPEVVDADLADYFGSIPHTELLKSVARRIVDRRVLHLIKMWP